MLLFTHTHEKKMRGSKKKKKKKKKKMSCYLQEMQHIFFSSNEHTKLSLDAVLFEKV